MSIKCPVCNKKIRIENKKSSCSHFLGQKMNKNGEKGEGFNFHYKEKTNLKDFWK